MDWYALSVVLHVLAAALWLGHMFFWSLFGGPALKTVQPPEAAALLRQSSLTMGGLGWPALAILVATGAYMIAARGGTLEAIYSAAAREAVGGDVLLGKLLLVGCMVVYQACFGHRPAPRAILVNMLVALLVLAAGVLLARGASL